MDSLNCQRKLTPQEIISGFNQDPNDFKTTCSACHYRFEPKLICFSQASQIELPFYCDAQTLHQMKGKEHLSPAELSRQHPAIYRSAIVHHGSIRGSFAKLGITYKFEEIFNWENKVTAFLGRLPDTIIAECVEVSTSVIRRMRQKLKIPAYMKKHAGQEIEEEL